MTAFVLCLPLLVVTLLSACDIWTLIAAQTRTQNVADAGCRYAVACANAQSSLRGTVQDDPSQPIRLSTSQVVRAALQNGFPHENTGLVAGVEVEVSTIDEGRATLQVSTYQDGSLLPEQHARSVPLSGVRVKASQRVSITSWPLRQLLGKDVVVSRISQERLPREVVV